MAVSTVSQAAQREDWLQWGVRRQNTGVADATSP